MPDLTLLYYDIPGRAEVIRKALAVAGVPFKDDRFPQAEHPQRKESQPYGKVPILMVDDEVVAETHPILRYVARLGGLYPPTSEPLAAALIDEIIDSFEDFFERVLMASFVERDAEKKKTMRHELMKGPLPDALQLIEKRLAQVAEYPFFKENAELLFVHDVVVWEYVVFFRSGIIDHVPTTFIDCYKTMVSIHDKVAAHSTVQQQQHSAKTALALPKKLKLTYFDMPGRAEQSRLAFCIGGIDFEDERISSDEFAKRKHELPNAQVPVLEVDGVVLAQSFAILRYIGTLTGLYPADDALQAAKVDEIMSHIGELYFTLGPSFKEQDPERKREMREALVQGSIPQSLTTLDKRLAMWKAQNKADSEFAMGGESLTIADLVIFSLVQFFQSGFMDYVPRTIIDPYKNILQANDAVKYHPRVQDWYAAHPLPTA